MTLGLDHQIDQCEAKEKMPATGENSGSSNLVTKEDDVGSRLSEDSILRKLRDGKLSDWEARRYGSIAARLLRDIKIT